MNFLPPPVHDLITALENNPSLWVIVGGLNLLGIMLQQFPIFPDKLNHLIPWLLALAGVVLTIFLVSPEIFPVTQPHPRWLLGIIGFALGFAAFSLHKWPVQWVTDFLENKFGKTQKPDQK